MTKASPPFFIGSSLEALEVAYALQEGLDFDTEPTVWTQGIFAPTKSTLNSLLSALGRFAFSAFVFTPDDVTKLRGSDFRVVRDNVLFEFGLFVGKLLPDRCFYLVPRGMEDFHLPTDLMGTTALTYRSDRKDGNLVAALGPACNQIRRAIRSSLGEAAQPTPSARLHQSLDGWNAPEMQRARKIVRAGIDTDPTGLSDAERASVRKIFGFLEAVSDYVLSGLIDEMAAKTAYGPAILSFWPHAAILLAPLNQVEEWWNPPPKIAELYKRWK